LSSDARPVSFPDREEFAAVLDQVQAEAKRYLGVVDELPVRTPGAETAAAAFDRPFPDEGEGANAALHELIERSRLAAIATSGPRCFHFVIGGATPASLGADWLASMLDQVGYAEVTSPLSTRLEALSLRWLGEVFGLSEGWGGIMTTGATMANFVGLAAARQWWGERHGVDIGKQGLQGLPPIPVFSSGYFHPSSAKCLSMLGHGYDAVRKFRRDERGAVDLEAMETALKELDGAPAVIVGNAGEVNAGDFDPISDLADLADRYGCWLHVDGAFGLFAAASPRTAKLVAGIERARSLTVDGHKWLNVPYDCGFSLVRDPQALPRSFAYHADYLVGPEGPLTNYGVLGPESSRRARSLSVWATLRAYGRSGLRKMIEGHLDLAQHLAARVDEAPDLERLADVPLNIVCFRYRPAGASEEELDDLNERLAPALLEDGRVYVGGTRYGGKAALRPAISNWRTREADIDFFVEVVREVGARLAVGQRA
jgi:glutamate/tyrosine decarboxylase-like PLP-dependent enzyme